MSEKETPNTSQPLTDDQIVTEKKLQRRSFLGSTGILLAGAAALATGLHAKAGGHPDDTPRPSDKAPDKPADRKHDDRDRTDHKRDNHDRDRRPDDRDKKPHDQSRT